jgi:hypothetical protein
LRVAVCSLLRREARAVEPAADWATRQSDGRAVDVHLDVDHAPQLLAYSVRFGSNWTRDYRARFWAKALAPARQRRAPGLDLRPPRWALKDCALDYSPASASASAAPMCC